MRFIEICLVLSGNTGDSAQLSTKIARNRESPEKTERFSTPDVKSVHISSGLRRDRCDSQEFLKETGNSFEKFYKWVPPGVTELSFSEKTQGNYQETSGFSRNRGEFSNTPPKQKEYLRVKACKSEVNLKKTAKNCENPSFSLGKSEETQQNELKSEIKRIRQCNHEYLKRNRDLEAKFFDLTNAYKILIDLFDKLNSTAREIATQHACERKLVANIEKLQQERKKIDNYLKFKSIFSYRFSEIVESLGKNTFNQYIEMNKGMYRCIFREFLLVKLKR